MIENLQRRMSDSVAARWTVLIAVSLTMMCGYFLTDAIAPLKTLLEQQKGWSSTDYGIFTSGYGWLNVFLLMMIFGGIILDKKGARFTGLMSIAVMVAGAALKYYAIEFMPSSGAPLLWGMKQQVLMAGLGYAIFAFGYETMNITATKLLVKWFTGKELALALGMNVAFARVGTILAMAAPLRIYEWTGSISMPILFATALLFLGLLTFLVVIVMDKQLDRQVATQPAVGGDEEKFKIRDIWSIVRLNGFWYIAVLCLVFYICVMTFQKFGIQFIGMKYGVDETSAGDLMSLLPIGALFLTPLFGGIYDKAGRGATMMILGCVMIIGVYGLFALPMLTSMAALVGTLALLGISFSLVPSAMWPSVAKIIPQQKLGTAYALIFWVQNIGLANAPLLIGWVLDKYCITSREASLVTYDYTLPMLIFMTLGGIALIFGLLLKRENRLKGYGLEDPNIKR